MVIFKTINIEIRTLFIKLNMGYIIANQILCNLHIYFYNYSYFLILLKHDISNLFLFLFSVIFWYLDFVCIPEIFSFINCHALWHIFSALSLYNVINTSKIYYCLINNLKYKIHFNNYIKYLYLNVDIYNIKINIRDIETNTKPDICIDMINLDKNINVNKILHRRIQSHS